MIDIKNEWHGVTDKQKWAARSASLMAKLKATKAVWFPPGPEDAGKKTAATAKGTKKATKKAASAARSSSAKKTVKKSVGSKTS